MHDTPDALSGASAQDDVDDVVGLTHQERTSAQREPMLLLEALASRYPGAGRRESAGGIELRRTPDRCVIQGEASAVSVSWFAPRLGEASAGELQIISWSGTVTMPGAPARPGNTAKMDRVHVFHLTRADGGGWCWRGEGRNEPVYSSEDLIAFCTKLLPAS